MTSQQAIGGLSGLLLGGLAGAWLGRSIEKRERSMDPGVATELGAILGGMVGAVTIAALATPATPPATVSV